MEKLVKDGQVAVLVSTGFGAGWYSWNTDYEELLFHPKLVDMVQHGRRDEIDEDWIKENLGLDNIYCGGACNLEVRWLAAGTPFTVYDYDGAETLLIHSDLNIYA